jgi:hypothetical protein
MSDALSDVRGTLPLAVRAAAKAGGRRLRAVSSGAPLVPVLGEAVYEVLRFLFVEFRAQRYRLVA